MKTLEWKPPIKSSLDTFLLHITYPHDGDPLRPRYELEYKLTGGLVLMENGKSWHTEDFYTAHDRRGLLNAEARPWRHQVRQLEANLDRALFSIETLGQQIQAQVEWVFDDDEWVLRGDAIAQELHKLILGGAE